MGKGNENVGDINKRKWFTFVKLLGIGLLFLTSFYIYEVFPRFITFSIPQPPNDDYPLAPWIFPIRSVSSPGSVRYFIWREFTTVQHDGISEEEERRSIGLYYDKQLQELGWTKSSYDSKSYTNCDTGEFFPEAFFLPSRQDFLLDGYVVYKRKPFPSFLTSRENNEVCLAVWRHWEHVPGIFHVVISTIKPSPLTWCSARNEFRFSQR